MALRGRFVIGGRHQKSHKAVALAASGPITIELIRHVDDAVVRYSTVTMTAIGFGIVFLMTLKPSLLGWLIAMALALDAGLVLASVALRWMLHLSRLARPGR